MTNESRKLSRSAQSVQDILSQKGLAFEVIELSSRHSSDLKNLTDGKICSIK